MNPQDRTASPPVDDRGIRSPVGAGRAVAPVIAVWVVFVVAGGLEPIGRHFLVLGLLRVSLFVALLGFAAAFVARSGLLGRLGLGAAAIGAGLNLLGGIGSVITDGWSYDPFGPGSALEPPWYAYVIGLSAFVFALGSILTGVAGRSGGWLAVAAVLGGVLYPMAFVMQGLYGHDPGDLLGHLIWIAPWLALTIGLARSGRSSA
ncbi:MAG: hypothetical protein ACR2FE_08090 [Aeromicrobium sp.]